VGRTEQATVSGGAGTRSPRARRRMYVSVTVKFLVAQGLSAGWLGVSIWLSLPWLLDRQPPLRQALCRRSGLPGPHRGARRRQRLDRRDPDRCRGVRRRHRPAGPLHQRAAPGQEPRPQHRPGGGPDRAGNHQGTLVAQGAFSLYRTKAARAAGGWPDAIREDIVLTWQLTRNGARVYYEPSAVAFTAAPARLVHLARQRARWARGMVEGLGSVRPWNQPRWLLRFLTAIDLLIPTLDVAYALVLLAATGRYWIVGPYTLAVLPLTLAVNLILYRFQRRRCSTSSGSGSGATPPALWASSSPTRC
jgi:Glycosyl transferase family group 2